MEVTIEKIINGYIIIFNNTENVKIKMYFATFVQLTEWLKNQFEPAGK